MYCLNKKIIKTLPKFDQIDSVAIITGWLEFKNLEFKKAKVFDGMNLLNK